MTQKNNRGINMFNNNPQNTYTPRQGSISTNTSESTTTYKIEKTANHTEISIMKSQWSMICKKINNIKYKSFVINIYELIIGASIPYIIEVFMDYCRGEQPDYFPIFICLLILAITPVVKKFVPIFNDNSIENDIHLNDIKDIINEIDKSQNEQH